MVVKPDQSWARSLVSFRATSLSECVPRILAATMIAVVVTWFERHQGMRALDVTPVPFSLMGVAIGIFLGFRGKTAYDRFWEGRTLWGALVNNCRNATRQVLTMLRCTAADREEVRAVQVRTVHILIAYAHALRHHLRDSQPWEDIRGLISESDVERIRKHRNVPLVILQILGEGLAHARSRGWLHDYHLPAADQLLTEITNVQGGCERIRNTPVPYAYGILSHRVVACFCFFLPLGIVDDVGAYTPLVTLMVFYAFFGLDALGTEVEEPFGTDPHDLPLTAICRTIEINLRQLLDETQLPEPLSPVDYVLN